MNTRIAWEKRVLSVLLTVIMVFSMVPLSVFAANGEAEVTVNGSTINFNSFAGAVEYANAHGGTLRLLSDVEVPLSENLDDIPFITGEFTLDLNGKSINEVGVGSVVLDEEEKITKGESGTLTVIDSVDNGNIECLAVNAGALTVAGGAITDLEAKRYAATVNITGGEVETFSLNENEEEKISATVSGGSVQWIRMNGGALTVTGGEYPEKINMNVGSGTTNITGGTFADLVLAISFGDIHLTGGTFAKISTDPEVGSSEYKNPPLASLLGDGCAFYGTDNGSIVNADVQTLENVKILANHEHSYGKSGKCTGCGAPCPHSRLDNATGICEDCGTQLEAKVTYTGKSPVYYTSFRNAIDSVFHNQKEQVTVTLLNYKYNLGTEPLYLSNSNNILLDLNGHTMSGSNSIIVANNSALTLANGKLDSGLTIEAAGGDVTVEKDCKGVGTVRVTNAKSTLTVLGGNIGSLRLPYTDTESLKNIKLSGGHYESVSFTGGGKTVVISDMLETGYAFKDNKGTLTRNPGDLVSYGMTVSADTYFANLEVVECEHGAVNEVKGYCNYCGKLYAAKITDKDGSSKYVEELTDWTLILAENCTVKLLQDAGRCNVTRNLTFDLNGHHVDTLALSADGTVTVKGSGSIRFLCLGNYLNDTTLIIEKPTSGTVDVVFLAVDNSTKTKLDGWSFRQIKRYDSLMLSDLLADGYALFDKTSGKPIYFSGKDTGVTADYYIDKHDHTFTVNADGKNQCECGLVCDHTDIGENGKCKNCKTQIYFATLKKADKTVTNYESFDEAWNAAIANENSTLKLLCDLDLGSGNGISLLGVYEGKFTLDLGGRTLEGTAQNTVIQVGGTADIKIIHGKVENKFDGSGSSLSPTDANAVRVESGSAALTLDDVKFTAGSNENARGSAVYVIDGKLTVTGSKFGGLVMLLKQSADASVKLASSDFLYGIAYGYAGTENDYETVGGFFADGNMFFDGNGKYIDITDDSLWEADDLGSYKAVTFSFDGSCSVKPHTHDTYVDGKCAECDYACPHDSGKNDREASCFQKAICSVCHAEYGDYVKDTAAPTGEIKIKERTWWQSLLNTISFGIFYKEKVTVEITADDDSYSQAGYDAAAHAVKIEYFISNTALSEDAVKASTFMEYSGAIDLSNENSYVIYAKLTDHAGNVAYASTDGFVVDTTLPVIEVDADGQSKKYSNGQRAEVCGGAQIKFIDDNFDTAYRTIDGVKDKIWSDSFLVAASDTDYVERWITFEVHDKAGNISTVEVYVHKEHSFNEETGVCATCGYEAAVLIKCSNDNNEEELVSGDGLDETMRKADENKFDRFYLKLYGNVEKKAGTYGSTSKNWIFDLNGYTISNPPSVDPDAVAAPFYVAGNITFVGKGAMNADIVVDGGQLTIDGECSFQKLEHKRGTLTVNAGSFEALIISKLDVGWSYTRETALYGGHYGEIKIVDIEGLTCADLLGEGCCFEGLSLGKAKVTALSNVTVALCYHEHIDKNYLCSDCGLQFVVAVKIGNVEKLFYSFEDAIRYAEQNEGCTVKLLQDLVLDDATVGSLKDGYRIYLEKGKYTIDLNGKTLDIINGSQVFVRKDCDLTIGDSAGGKVISSSGDGDIYVGHYSNNNAKLTVTGGEFTVNVTSHNQSALVLKGGSFKRYVNSAKWAKCSPFVYLSEGYTFALIDPVDGNSYANEGNAEVDHDGSQMIMGVSVVPVPLVFRGQPTDVIFYLTSPDAKKCVDYLVSYVGEDTDKKVTLTPEKADGSKIATAEVPAAYEIAASFDMAAFGVEHSGQYRIRAEFSGYVLYSNTFTVTVAECEHPGYDRDNKCSQCGCDLAAAIVKDGKTTGYVNFADALAAAQTDENKGCVLWLLTDVTGKVTVSGGDFKFSINGYSIGGLGVTKTAKLNIFSGTVNGTVTVAKTANLIASVTNFMGAVNDLGNMSSFINCVFVKSLSAKGSNTNLNNCTINGALNVSGNKVTLTASTVYGKTTVNNGGLLRFMGNGGKYGETLVKSGGGLEVYANNTLSGTVTAESGSKLTLSGGVYTKIAAVSGAKLTISGGEFKNITVNGQHLIDCLAEGKAFEDMNNGFIIDGRVGIAGDVKVVDHTHTCVWKTDTHERLCGCGYVEATDTEAPVISGIDPDNNHYGSLEFSVTDENDFTVWLDGKEITLVNGKYTMEPDNDTHLITATDVAGNTVSFRFGIFKTYHVTLPTGAGYTIFPSDGLTVRHGDRFSFIVQFNKGYSRTEDFKVLVNGNKLDELWSYTDSASFVVVDVSEDLVITVEGVADITAPEVEVNIHGNSFKEFLNRITFGLFFKETQSVEVKANDFGSGVDKVEYLLSETAFADKDAITGNWTELTLNESRKAYFSIAPNQKAFIYVRVTDQSGNIAVVNTDGVVLYTDAEAITGAQTFTKNTDFDVVYKLNLNGNTLLAVYNNAAEEIKVGTEYALLANGMFMLKNSYLSKLAAGEYTIYLTFKPMGENYVDNYGNAAPAEVFLKLTVEKKTPTLDHTPSDGKSYDGKPIGKPTVDTDSDGARTFEYKRADEEDTAYTTEAPKNVGKYVIRITTAETDTFKAASSTMEFEIQPKEVTISDVQVADKTYDGTANAAITNAGTLSDNYDGDDLVIVAGKAAYDNKNVGTDKAVSFTGFELSGSAAGNYKLIAQPASTTADITAKEITVIGAAVESSKVYDGTTDAEITNAGTPSDNYDGENLSIVAGAAAYDNKNVGTGKTVTFTGFALAGNAAVNYKLVAQPASVTADITVKEITVNGATVETSRIYDGTTSAKITNAGTPSVNYDGENLKVAAGKAVYDSKHVGTGKTVTFSGFSLTGSAAGNYKLTAQPDAVTADITVKEMKIVDTAVEASKVYDGSTDAKITEKGTFSGLVNGDKVHIVTGKAAYDDRNVGNGKAVTFYDFALSGDDAANYVLAAQPAGTTASITPKKLTIKNLKVKDKQYDGKNTAAIDGTPTLVGVVDGDVLELVNGVPTFDSVKIGKNIAISFTAFTLSGDRVTVGNYTLTQPSGITASIVAYVADGSEYEVNSNDWINTDFVITAKEGYKLSRTDTANGEWTDTLTASDETRNGKLIFYVKNTETGVISVAVTENYKIDKTAPTGEVSLNERTAFQEFINTITFGLFFKDDVHVKLTASDEASGVKSVLYFKSDRILTDAEVRAITDWTDNSDFDIEAEDMEKFVVYVRIEDNAGNVTLIGSDGAIFDTTAPAIVGVSNDKTYYVTKRVAIDDENLQTVTLNGDPVEAVFTLAGDTETTYVICATDKAGNVTEYTVYMQPISSITDAISGVTVDNVKSSDAETISSVERQILDIAETFDDGESTEEEWNKLIEAAAKCKALNGRIADVADESIRLTDAVNDYDIGKVTSTDKADVEKLIADIDTLLDGDNLTDAERAALEALKGTARMLLDRIAAAKDAAEAEEIQAVDGITKDNVKLENKESLEKAEKALEGALRDFDGNYTEEEQGDLEAKLETVKAALAAIDKAEKAAEAIGQLPSADDAKLGDKSELDRVQELIDGLTENEKAMLGKDAVGKLDALAERLQRLEEKANSPKTGSVGDLTLWIALLFISGGIAAGALAVKKKQEDAIR